MSQKIFDNELVTTYKSNATLTLNKQAYVGMYILELSQALMYVLHYDYIKINMVTIQDYYSLTLLV